MKNLTLKKDTMKDGTLRGLKEIFYLACEHDDSQTIKNYLEMQLINPCENSYNLLKYAIDKKCEKIVNEILNSNFFYTLPKDTRAAIQMSAKTGDASFAMYMLK